jgi:exodeoxyribonuclease VII large subunit
MPQVEKPEVWSVSQLTRQVKNLLETEVSRVWVQGEISNWRLAASGHAYFTLKDKQSQIDAVMFKGRLNKVKFEPDTGLEVIVYGLVTVYERRGNYQIVCEEMQPRGVGALQLALEKLKLKLSEEGLFDAEHKKPLPLLPRKIGVVTSPTGAAIRDILNVISRRFANVEVLLYPARVQGDEAAPEIAEGIRALDAWGVDVMIVGRGGGSLEDLWPFNEEVVVRAVFEAKTPVISAVGHEIDYALTDFAADVRAPTPSAAAELVVKEQQALADGVTLLARRLGKAMGRRTESARTRLKLIQASVVFQRPEELVTQRQQAVDDLRQRLDARMADHVSGAQRRVEQAVRALGLLSPGNQVRRAAEQCVVLHRRLVQAGANQVDRLRARLRPVIAQLDALSPLAVLSRGYALAWQLPEKALVRDAKQLKPDDKVLLKFGAGGATAVIERIEEDENG